MSSGFKNSDLFIKQSQKNPSSPYTPTTSVSVGLNGKRFPAKECISCISSCSFPCWQHTWQNVLLQSTSCCVICLLPPILFLLKASSVPAHELDTRAVPLSRMGFQLEAVDVTSAAAEPWPLREEHRGHSPLVFFFPAFQWQDSSPYFLGYTSPLQVSRQTVVCWNKTQVCRDWEPKIVVTLLMPTSCFHTLLSHRPASTITSVFSLCVMKLFQVKFSYLSTLCGLIPW